MLIVKPQTRTDRLSSVSELIAGWRRCMELHLHHFHSTDVSTTSSNVLNKRKSGFGIDWVWNSSGSAV